MAALHLPRDLRGQIEREASDAFPRECCGLIEGVRDGAAVRVLALRPSRNLAPEPDRFEIDPARHIALLRALRGTEREIVGCYHSHPGGGSEPSARDGGMDFVWLIAALDAHGVHDLAAHVPNGGGWRRLALCD